MLRLFALVGVLFLTQLGLLLAMLASPTWRLRFDVVGPGAMGPTTTVAEAHGECQRYGNPFIFSSFGLQALINISVVSGLAPTKGIALPLVSHGGTGWILTAAALGLVIGIDRTSARTAKASAEAVNATGEVPAAHPVVS